MLRPEEPVGLVVDVSGNDVSLSWNGVSLDVLGQPETINHYNVYRGTAPGYVPDRGTFLNRIGTPPSNSFSDTGVFNDGQDYYYLVSAVDDSANESNVRATRISRLPVLIAFYPINGVNLFWTTAELPIDVAGYRVYWGTDPAAFEFSADVGDVLSHKISTLSMGVEYHVAVGAYDAQGNETTLSNTLSGQLGDDYFVDIVGGDNGTGVGTPEQPWQHISYAQSQLVGICPAVHAAAGTYSPAAGESFPIEMQDCISLIGDAGAAVTVLDAQASDRVVRAVNVGSGTTLQGFTITGGAVSGHGAGVFIDSSSLGVVNNIITGNTTTGAASELGGGIYVAGTSAPFIQGNEISGNTASGSTSAAAGGVYLADSGTSGTFVVSNTIADNTAVAATDAFGGGIHAGSGGEIRSNHISGNSVSGSNSRGGGVYFAGDAEVAANSILDNTGATHGGGIHGSSIGASARIRNNVVVGNQATVAGGGIRLSGNSAIPLVNNTVSYNTGDAISIDAAGLNLVNNILSHNSGYGLREETAAADPVAIKYNDLYQNALGAYFDEAATAYADLVALEGAVPEAVANLEADPLFFSPEDDSDHTDDDYRIRRFSPCIDAGFDGPEVPFDDVALQPRPFDYDRVDHNGNRLEYDIGADEFTIVEYHVAVGGGSDLTGDGSPANPWAHIGHALTQVSAPATILVQPGVYSLFVDAEGQAESFPIVLEDGVSLVSTDGSGATTIDAGSTARVIEAQNLGAWIRLQGFTIRNGVADSQGGGIYLNNAQLEVVSNWITENRTSGTLSAGLGGGIFVGGDSAALISGNEISANLADGSNSGYGGAIALSGSLTSGTRIENNTITGNSVGFASNTYGGAIYAGSGAIIVGNEISSNTSSASTANGGGIYMAGNTLLSGNRIVDNTGVRYGGGVYGVNLQADSRIENNLIVGNSASLVGGGVRITGSPVPIVNNTFAHNDGSGVALAVSGATLLNNIFSHNTGHGIEEETTTSDPADVRFNDFFQNSAGMYLDEDLTSFFNLDLLQAVIPEISSNIALDPAYISPADDADHTDDDYGLQAGSGCIDAGWDGAEVPTVDVDGDARAFDAAGIDNNGPLWEFDIGADEWIGADTVAPLFTGLEEARPGDTFVDLLWSPALDSSQPVAYDVYVRTTAESHNYNLPDFTTFDTFFQVDGLTNGETYFFVVKARDALGQRDGNLVELSATPQVNALTGVFVDITFGSDVTGDGSFANPWRHITYALTQVGSPETIRVRPGLYDTTVDGDGFSEVFPIQLADGVSILSTGGASVTTVDADRTAGVFDADGVGAGTRLEGFTITGGLTTAQGGAFYVLNSSLEIRDNVITDNQSVGSSAGWGGGLYIVGTSSAIIENNEITDNLADGSNSAYGGGIAISGTGTNGTRIEGNTIARNTCGNASSVYGAGIYAPSGAEIRGNRIEGNVLIGSTKRGGGIYTAGASVRLLGNRILDHAGATYGGGIYGSGLSSTGRIVNNIVVGNEATLLGGGVRLSNSSSVELVNNTIAANTGDGISMDASGAVLINNIVSHNTGYGIREEDTTADPVTLVRNDLHQNGTGLYLDEATNAIVNIELVNGLLGGASDNLDVDPQYVAGPDDADHTDDDYRLLDGSPCIDAGHDGVEVPVDDIDGEVRPYDFAGVDNNGAALDFDIGADEFFIPVGDITAPVFDGLESLEAGSNQVCLDWSEADDPSRPVLYSIYRAATPGGQTFVTATATTYRTSYCDGTVPPGTTACYVVRAEDYAGNGETNTVELCAAPLDSDYYVDIVSGSDATGDGSSGDPWRHITYALTQAVAPATVFVRPGTYDTTVDLDGYSEVFPIAMRDDVSLVSTDGAAMTTIDAESTTRVIDIHDVGAGTRLEGFTISGGSISGQGGGIHINNSAVEVRANVVTGNQAIGSNSGAGGGVYVAGTSPAWIVGNEIRGNLSDGGNSAFGGGLFLSPNGTGLRVEQNTIADNTVGYANSVYGGGVYASSGVELRANTLSGNVLSGSTRYGGGIYATGNVSILRNTIVDNSGATYGGGIYTSSLSSTDGIRNNSIVGNDATIVGGGLRMTGTSVVPLVNNTVSYNVGDGIALNASGATLLNNVVSHNTGYGIREESATADPATVQYNDLFANASGLYLDEGSSTYVNLDLLQSNVAEADLNLEADPQFVSPENDADHTDDDYHLQPTSPCIDAGSDDAFVPFDDIDGDARAFDAAGIDNNGP
ncbi:MAG: DUF1565 domain-containing protein, partial [bacterium]|nr:DUF1565 domain-containing protein [bacterium]